MPAPAPTRAAPHRFPDRRPNHAARPPPRRTPGRAVGGPRGILGPPNPVAGPPPVRRPVPPQVTRPATGRGAASVVVVAGRDHDPPAGFLTLRRCDHARD